MSPRLGALKRPDHEQDRRRSRPHLLPLRLPPRQNSARRDAAPAQAPPEGDVQVQVKGPPQGAAAYDLRTAGRVPASFRQGALPSHDERHQPLLVERECPVAFEEGEQAQPAEGSLEMAAATCEGCPLRTSGPIHQTRDGRYTLELTAKDHRLAGHRREQETPVFAERYATRSGIESTNSGSKNRLGLKRLRVRGSVFRVILHKVASWNVLRAAASKKLRPG